MWCMEKTEVYSWRIDPELKSDLEDAARAEGTSLSRLLDRITANWLQREHDLREGDEDLRKTRQRALAYVGSIRGRDRERAGAASQRVQAILKQKHARRRAG